ncbi:MAG: sulfatase, partial [Armatimonadota bacterium]
ELTQYIERFYEGGDPYDPDNHSLDRLRELPLMNFFISGGAVPELRDGLTDINYPIAQYDAEICYADDRFGQMLETLDDLGVLDDTMIIFTSDHGEALGEHDVYFDHMDAYEQVAHVPLIVWWPERVKPRSIDALVQHIDFAPTILEAFGLSVPEGFQGRSLWPLLEGRTDEHYETVFTNQGLWSAQRAMRTTEWTLVKTITTGILDPPRPPVELYHRRDDMAEAHDVASERPEVVAQLELKYFRWLDEQLGPRPDPLRIAGEESAAAESVKRRYREHLAREEKTRATVSPKDRAAIDARPGG